MTDAPRFFIVTPSINQGRFIVQTIESVQSQVDTNTIHVIMDGGSTDETVGILKSYHAHKNFYWFSQKDTGQSDALNKGIEFIKTLHPKSTDVFAYINSDDQYLPKAFQQVVATFKKHPQVEWLVGDAKIVDTNGKEIQKPIRMYKRLWLKLLSPSLLSILNPIPQPAVFMRWSAVEKTGLFNQELRYTMDYEYWQRLYQKVGSPKVFDVPLSSFRIHGNSKGGSQFSQQFAEEYMVARQYTGNSALLFLHKLHNSVITSIYSLIK